MLDIIIRIYCLLISKLPKSYIKYLGSFQGYLLYLISRKRRNITKENLRLAFPKYSSEEINKIAIGSYINLAITIIEIMHLHKINEDNINNWIEFKNFDLLQLKHKLGKGLLLLSGHYGNWELLCFATGLNSGVKIKSIANPQRNKTFDEILNHQRNFRGNEIIPMNQSAKTVIEELKNQRVIAMLADQSATINKDVYVDFFGVKAATFESPAKLALKFKIPMLIAFAKRRKDSTYFAEFIEIPHNDLQYNKEGILELTQRHVKILEDAIREQPEMWSWQHRRWKHSNLNLYNE